MVVESVEQKAMDVSKIENTYCRIHVLKLCSDDVDSCIFGKVLKIINGI